MDWTFWLLLLPLGLFFWAAFLVLLYVLGKSIFEDIDRY